MNLDQMAAGASPEVIGNENFQAVSAAGVFGKRPATTSGLTWGYYGCDDYNGNAIAHGTVALTDDATNYVVVLRSTGVISASTSTTNSTNPLYARLYKLVTVDGAVTAETDERWKANGLMLAPNATAIGDMVLADVQTVTGAKTFGAPGAVGKLKIAGNTSGAATLDAPAVAGTIVITLPATTGTLALVGDITTAINAVIAAAPGALDTLDELAAALGDDANFASTVTTALALKAPLASPALTGTPTAPTATGGTNTTQIATTAFVQSAVAGGVSDGDKGDITVSSTGTVWTLDNDTVTNAKAANMAQGTLKGRVTASTGDPEDLTYNQQRILLNKKQTLTSGTTVTPDCDSGLNMRLVLAHNMTLANPTNLVDGDVINLRVKQDATGSRLLSAVGSKWKFPGGTLPVLSTAANAVDFISGHYDSTDDTITAVCSKAFA